MKSSNRHEIEAIGCCALFVLGILALVCWSLYERGYLGIAAAVIGGVAIPAGIAYALRARTARKARVKYRRYQEVEQHRRYQEVEQQERLPREQEEHREYEEWFIPFLAREEREVEEHPIEPLREEEPLGVPLEEEEPPRVPLEPDDTVRRLDELSRGEFEQLIAYYFRNQGYVVDTTSASGGRGADLIIAAAEQRISILLKREDAPVGNRAVQEALGGRAFYGAHEAWLITNGTFSQVTRYEARRKGVRLVDGEELAEWLDQLSAQLEDEP